MALDLADGSRVALTVARAADRQARLRLRLSRFPDVWELAPIVDVVRWDPARNTYQFTGQTLAEWLTHLRRSNRHDLRQVLPWCVECSQALMRRTLELPRHPPSLFSVELARPPYRSALKDRIRALPQGQAPVAQWISALARLTEKGIREEEIKESGVLQRLAQFDPETRLRRAQVVNLVQLSHLVPKLITESSLAFVSTVGWRECCERIPVREARRRRLLGQLRDAVHLVRFRHRAFGWSIVLSRSGYRDLFLRPKYRWSVFDHQLRQVSPQSMLGFDSPETAIAFANSQIARSFASWAKPQKIDRYRKHSLLGGERYHELLFQIDDWTKTFDAGHFAPRNILVHARTSLRTTERSDRVLFVDELQSDWIAHNHAARREDYGIDFEVPAPFKKEWPLLALKTLLWWAQKCGAEGLMLSSEQLQRQRWRAPPTLLYESLLPRALKDLATPTGGIVDRSLLRVHGDARRIVSSPRGWAVLDRKWRPITRPFKTRGQAEHFARLTGPSTVVDLPVLWINHVPQITAIPLYGAGDSAEWFRPTRGTARTC